MRTMLFIFFLLPSLTFAQVWDDFSDGDFTQNPSWIGDVENFVVNDDFHLQLNDLEAGESALTTAFSFQGDAEWRFWIKQSFSPSSNNFGRFYLMADQVDLKGSLNGYFLQMGESGTADAIELFRQNGDELTSICRGTDELIASSFELGLRVRKDAQGYWTIEIDQSGIGAYQLEASGLDDEISNASFLGLFCKYTASNADRFYLDNIYAGPFVVDEQAPQVQTIIVNSATNLEIVFDEAVEVSSAENRMHYFVSNQIAYPLLAKTDPENPAQVNLSFERSFPNGEELSIHIENVADLTENVMVPMDTAFVFFTPAVHDVLINEIMADPTPQVGLPEWEYVELFNRTSLPVNLSGWKLKIGNSEKDFEAVSIAPGDFLILGDEDAAGSFTFSGSFYGFSSFALTNAGQSLVLLNAEGAVISFVEYTDEWYRDSNKDDGGWALEQIDPANPCGGSQNWMASINSNGGTPGQVNSVDGDNPDTSAPFAQRIEITGPSSLILHFSESMDSSLLAIPGAYQVSGGIGNPLSAKPIAPGYQSVDLLFSAMFENERVYTLTILDANFADCAGNAIDTTIQVSFGLPETVAENDIVINEVLFNPKDDIVAGVDFVEIYNRSQKILDLKYLILANEDEDTGELSSPKEISEEGFLFFPGEYRVLTTDPAVVQAQYANARPGAFLKMPGLPTYANSEGVVVLATKGFEHIDRVRYSEDMQNPLLTSFDGVSLERLHYDRPSSDSTNWLSAAGDVGYATPGYQNSQFGALIETEDAITIDPEIFSPDGDGNNDVLNIYYRFDAGGQNCTIKIYDSRGRQVRTLVNNETIGTEGLFSWDGLSDDHQKSAIGIYVIFVEVWDYDGHRQQLKKSAVLATRL